MLGDLELKPGMKAAVDHLAVRASQVHCRHHHSLSAIISLSLSLSLSLSRARALALTLSLARALSLSFVLSPSSDPRSALCSPSGVAIVFWQRSSSNSSSSSASEISQALSCRHRQAINPPTSGRQRIPWHNTEVHDP